MFWNWSDESRGSESGSQMEENQIVARGRTRSRSTINKLVERHSFCGFGGSLSTKWSHPNLRMSVFLTINKLEPPKYQNKCLSTNQREEFKDPAKRGRARSRSTVSNNGEQTISEANLEFSPFFHWLSVFTDCLGRSKKVTRRHSTYQGKFYNFFRNLLLLLHFYRCYIWPLKLNFAPVLGSVLKVESWTLEFHKTISN